MKYRISHTTKFSYSESVPICHNLVHLAPRELAFQSCLNHRLLIRPEPVEMSSRRDFFGNELSYFSIDRAHRGLTVTSTSEVEIQPRASVVAAQTAAWEDVADQLYSNPTDQFHEAYPFTLDSPSVSCFPELATYARKSFQDRRPILEAARDLKSRIFSDFKFDPRATTIHTPIQEVFSKRRGVCQDFAHLQIGCLRALGLAARYVSGYLRTEPPPGKPRLVGADASHAWLAIFCGNAGWVDLDPTNNKLVDMDYITVAWGRDYHDVRPIQGVIIGGGEHRMEVSVDVLPMTELDG